MHKPFMNPTLALIAVVTGAACEGAVMGQPGDGGSGSAGNLPTGLPVAPSSASSGSMPATAMSGAGLGDTGMRPGTCGTAAAPLADAPLRRLTREQWGSAVTDLFGVPAADAAMMLPEDERVGPFPGNAALPPSELHVRRFADAAEQIAAAANVSKLISCTDGEPCAAMFIDGYGRRAFRRPLTAGERDGLLAVYRIGREAATFAGGIALVIEAMLSSPQFLYLVEKKTGAGPGRVPLDGYEIAARLSFFLWGSGPDDALLSAAATGRLADADGVRAEATRLLGDPRARGALSRFVTYWLDISSIDRLAKDQRRLPRFDATVRAAMKAETLEFFDYVLRRGDASARTLLTASFSFPDRSLLPIYGLAVPAGFEPKKPTALHGRVGVLTQPSVLATHANPDRTSPVKRGNFVLKNLLCYEIPLPAIDIPPLPEPDPSKTTREQFAQHTSVAACAACHKIIDPVGFGFEKYDASGVYRELEGGRKIDASGTLSIGSPEDGPFDGAAALVQKLLRVPQFNACLPTQWFRFAHARKERPEDGCALDDLRGAFAASGGNLRTLILTLVASDSFRFRPGS